MDPKFAILVEALAPKLDALLAMPPLQNGDLPKNMLTSGVYLFTESGRHLYVGRSNRYAPDTVGILGQGLHTAGCFCVPSCARGYRTHHRVVSDR